MESLDLKHNKLTLLRFLDSWTVRFGTNNRVSVLMEDDDNSHTLGLTNSNSEKNGKDSTGSNIEIGLAKSSQFVANFEETFEEKRLLRFCDSPKLKIAENKQ